MTTTDSHLAHRFWPIDSQQFMHMPKYSHRPRDSHLANKNVLSKAQPIIHLHGNACLPACLPVGLHLSVIEKCSESV
jgi:hypothetical protein